MSRLRVTILVLAAALALSDILGAVILIRRNGAGIQAICESGNVQNAKQRNLWEHFLEESQKTPPVGPARKAREKAIADARAYINATFADVDCSHPHPVPSSSATLPAGRVIAGPTVTATATATIRAPGGVRTVVITRTVTRVVTRCVRPNGRPC